MGKVFDIGFDYPNSRKQEIEADKLGLQLAAKVILYKFLKIIMCN